MAGCNLGEKGGGGGRVRLICGSKTLGDDSKTTLNMPF